MNVIIYKSKYGATKQYAQWLAEETGFEPIPLKKVNKQMLNEADKIILGSSVFAGLISLKTWVKKNWPMLEDKTLAFYTSMVTEPEQKEEIQKIWENAFPEEIRSQLKFFPMGGKIIYNELNWIHKKMIGMVRKHEKNPEIRAKMSEDINRVERANINPLVDFVKQAK